MRGVHVSEKTADYLELGPNCPPGERCLTCREHHYCHYEENPFDFSQPTKWMTEAKAKFGALKRMDSPRDQYGVAVELSRYLIRHRGYYRLADTLMYIAQKEEL